MTDQPASGCREFPQSIADCPLYALSHDARFSGFGCVDKLDKPCLVSRGKRFSTMLNRANSELFKRVRAHYGAKP